MLVHQFIIENYERVKGTQSTMRKKSTLPRRLTGHKADVGTV